MRQTGKLANQGGREEGSIRAGRGLWPLKSTPARAMGTGRGGDGEAGPGSWGEERGDRRGSKFLIPRTLQLRESEAAAPSKAFVLALPWLSTRLASFARAVLVAGGTHIFPSSSPHTRALGLSHTPLPFPARPPASGLSRIELEPESEPLPENRDLEAKGSQLCASSPLQSSAREGGAARQ